MPFQRKLKGRGGVPGVRSSAHHSSPVVSCGIAALDDILKRLENLVDVMESAEGSLTEVPEPA